MRASRLDLAGDDSLSEPEPDGLAEPLTWNGRLDCSPALGRSYWELLLTEIPAGNGNGVQPCGAGKFCCYGFGGCDCNNSTQVFTLDPVKVVTTIPTDASRVDEKTTAISDATTGASSSTVQSTVTHTNTSAAESESSSSEASSSNNALPIGLGVGIGAGVLLIGLGVGFWLWRRKKRASASKPVMVSDDYMHKPPVETANPPVYGQYQPVKPAELSANADRVELP
jgi:hypothetical protein